MSTTAFVDVTAVAMDEERLLEHQTVLVQEGRIVACGSVADVVLPDDAVRIDGRGRYLMPGLVDMHVHYNTSGPTMEPSFAVLFLANGVTTVRNMAGAPAYLAARNLIARGEGFGPAIYTSGPIMDGQPPVWPGSVVIETKEEAERSVAELKERGYDFLKVYSNLTIEAYDAIIVAARRYGMRVVGHVPERVGLQHVLESGQSSVEHLHGYLSALADGEAAGTNYFERTLHALEHGDESKIPILAGWTAESGAWNCVTLVVHRRMGRGRIAFEEERQRPELRYLSPVYETEWTRQLAPAGDPARIESALRRAEELRGKIVRALRAVGAPLLLGSDTPNPFVIPGFSIHEELELLVEAGLSPFEALRAGTRDAAAFLGALDEFGSVAPGLRADLILSEANPLDDVRNVARRVGVMVRGQWLSEAELQSMLEDVATAAHEAPGDLGNHSH